MSNRPIFQKAKPLTKCVFCGYVGDLTAEHLFSAWTHKYLPPRRTRYKTLKRITAPGKEDTALFKRGGDIRDTKIKCVCEISCNNGWMRDLVDEPAMPIMEPLIRGEARGIRLSSQEQQIIATWAALKAMVMEFEPMGVVTTHHMQRKLMMKKQLPPSKGWRIWIGDYARREWEPHLTSSPFCVLPDDRLAHRVSNIVTHYNGNSTTQVVGRLFIHVLRSPHERFIRRWQFPKVSGGKLRQIWPLTGYSFEWPPPTLTDQDADDLSTAVWKMVMRAAALPGRPGLT